MPLTSWRSMSPVLRKSLEVANKLPNQDKIVVLGGTGCVGERICKHATQEDYNVWSLSQNFPNSFPNLYNKFFHPVHEDKPWPMFMTWRQFDIQEPFDNKDLLHDLYGAKTLILCIGQRKPAFLNYCVKEEGEGQFVSDIGYGVKQLHQRILSSAESFEELNVRSIVRALDVAKAINVRNFIYISVSGLFPSWTMLFDRRFLSYKRRGEKILEGVHYSVDGTPINMAILRPAFIYTERRPISAALALIHSSLFSNSFGSSNLTADRVARCALKVAAEFPLVRSERNRQSESGEILEGSTPHNWVLEDEDMLRFLDEH